MRQSATALWCHTVLVTALLLSFQHVAVAEDAGDSGGSSSPQGPAVDHCFQYNPQNVTQCTQCTSLYAVDAALNECVSQLQCWEGMKVFVNDYAGRETCEFLDEAACDSRMAMCMCPSGYVTSLDGSRCITTAECWATGDYYDATEFPGNAGALCYAANAICVATECFCANGHVVGPGMNCHCTGSNCMKCRDEMDICEECREGFYLTNRFYCQNCLVGCLQCTEAVRCTVCTEGYFLDAASALCMPCNEGCKSCTSLDTCTACTPEYVGPNCAVKCSDHVPGCWKCQADGARCERCWLDDVKEDGTCNGVTTKKPHPNDDNKTSLSPDAAATATHGFLLVILLCGLVFIPFIM